MANATHAAHATHARPHSQWTFLYATHATHATQSSKFKLEKGRSQRCVDQSASSIQSTHKRISLNTPSELIKSGWSKKKPLLIFGDEFAGVFRFFIGQLYAEIEPKIKIHRIYSHITPLTDPWNPKLRKI